MRTTSRREGLRMPTNPPILLLDTNVWLDLFLPHRPGREVALRLVEESERRGAALSYPAHAILDVYQKIRSDNKRWIRQTRDLTELDAFTIKRLAWDYIDMMRKMATAVPADTNDVALACKFRDAHDDLEDDLVLAACQRSHANYLVTNDASLAGHTPITALSPSAMLEILRAGRAKGTPSAQDSANSTDWLYRWLSEHDA